MIAFFFCPSANRTAGTRYASDLPTPVPASTTRCRSSSSARATAAAICCCCGRRSKFFAFARSPFGEKNDSVRSTKSEPIESRNAIIALTRAYSGFSPFGKAIRGRECPLAQKYNPAFRLKARRNTDLQVCAPSGVALRCNRKRKRTECPLGAQAEGLCSGTCQSRDARFNFIVITGVELRGSRSTVTSGVLHESI